MIDLTIIIPTHNRKKLVLRNLNYLSNFNIKVIISESCDLSIYEKHSFTNSLFLDCKNLTMHQKISKALYYVNTSYVAICADDDFISIDNLEYFLNFLEKNNDYSIVDGTYIYFKSYFGFYKINKAYKNKYNYDNYYNDPNQRIKYAINNYTNFMYSVMRKKDLKICLDFVELVIGDNNLPEITEISINLISSILGKQRSLPKFWMSKDLNRYSHYTKISENNDQRKKTSAKVIGNWNNFFKSDLGIKYKKFITSEFFLNSSKFDLDELSIIYKKDNSKSLFRILLKNINKFFNGMPLMIYKKIRIFFILFTKKDNGNIGYPWNSDIEKNHLKLIFRILND